MIGLGYVGLPTAAVAAGAGYDVLGVEVRAERVRDINDGKSYLVEPGMEELIAEQVANGRLKAATEPTPAEYFVIAVPTPFREGHQPDVSIVEAAADSIAPHLQPGNTVILESTSPVGTTEALVKRIAKLRPDLVMPGGAGEDDDYVAFAYCPERVLPGQSIRELKENDRVIGGITPVCAQRASAFYRGFLTTGQCFETTAATSELVKLSENAYRDVNIAFANELSIIAESNGVNPWKLIALANRHPRVTILQPGPGVGGHCIAVDPWFIVARNPDDARIIRTAREVNTAKTDYVIEKVLDAMEVRQAKKVALLGLSYKPNVDDVRESPSLHIVNALQSKSNVELLVVEPHISVLPKELRNSRVRMVTMEEAHEAADLLVVLVKHDAFRRLRELLPNKPMLDLCGLYA